MGNGYHIGQYRHRTFAPSRKVLLDTIAEILLIPPGHLLTCSPAVPRVEAQLVLLDLNPAASLIGKEKWHMRVPRSISQYLLCLLRSRRNLTKLLPVSLIFLILRFREEEVMSNSC